MTDTDREIIDLLVEHRVATTQQLQQLLDIPERTVRYRLNRLREIGMAACSRPKVERGSAPDHWFPTKAADSWAKGASTLQGGERSAPGTAFVAHGGALTALYVALLRVGPSLGLTLVTWAREIDATEEFEHAGRMRKIVPDAFVVLDGDGAEYRAFVEVDMGSMSMTRLTRKLSSYAAYAAEEAWRDRHPFPPTLLVLTTTQKRAEAIVTRFEQVLAKQSRDRMDRMFTDEGSGWVPVIGACDGARDPDGAISESVWLSREGVDGLVVTALLEPTWLKWSDLQAAKRAGDERRALEKEHFARDPEARRAQLQRCSASYTFTSHAKNLGGEAADVMVALLEGTTPMTAVEKAAFAFFERRVDDTEDEPRAVGGSVALADHERDAVVALVSEVLESQRRRVATLHAHLPEFPSMLRAIEHLDQGLLLHPWEAERIKGQVRRELRMLGDMQTRKRAYLSWREQRIETLRSRVPAGRRLVFNRERAALQIDHEHLRYCERCHQIAIPSDDELRRGVEPSCLFCHNPTPIELPDALSRSAVKTDDHGFWEVCHPPVPGWVHEYGHRTVLPPFAEVDLDGEP